MPSYLSSPSSVAKAPRLLCQRAIALYGGEVNTSNNASFVGLRHPELVSGSEELNRQMLNQRSTPEGAKVKQVIRYAHRKSYLIS